MKKNKNKQPEMFPVGGIEVSTAKVNTHPKIHVRNAREALELIGKIDFNYFCIGEVLKELNKPNTPLENYIDEVTGFGRDRFIKNRRYLLSRLRGISTMKAALGYDTKAVEETIEKIRKLK